MAIIQNLVAEEFGSFIGKYQGRLKVMKKGECLVQAPLLHLESVIVGGGGVSISADAVRACAERGIPIHFLSGTGHPVASVYSAGLAGTVLTRRAQLAAFEDGRGVHLALCFAAGKIQNGANLLRYSAKYRKESDPALYQELRLLAGEVEDHLEELRLMEYEALREGWVLGDMRGQLFSVEGRAAQVYWRGIRLLVPDELGWPGREGRGARDPFNSALNYGYGIVYSAVERAIVLAGLDPYAGFVHTDRPGKTSLVYDMVEEFRAVVVDRTVLGLVNRGVRLNQDGKGFLVEATRRQLAEGVLNRLEANERYRGKRFPLRAIMQMQARSLGRYVRGECEAYVPFVARW